MRPSISLALPAPATIVVLSLSMVTFLALPRSSIFTFSSFIAILTGGKAITEDLGTKLENVKIEDLGKAKRLTIDKDNTTSVASAGKARVEDAMHATRAAVEEGIVSGGGVALLRCLPVLEKLKLHDDEAIGVNIVKRALEEPLRQIALNAGHEGAVVVGRVRESRDENFGFNAETGEFGDLVKAGVIDPAKVTRLALQNAASIVSLMLTTEVLIAAFSGQEKMVAAGAGGGMGGSY